MGKYYNNLLSFLKIIEGIEGDLIEVGTHNGRTTKILCDYVQNNKLNKKVFSIDTFEGYIKEDLKDALPETQTHAKNHSWEYPYEKVLKFLEPYNNFCTIWKGDSKIEIPKKIKDNTISKVCLLYVDCNLYPPSIKCIKDVFPLISKGGVVVIDEHWLDKYGKYGGESKALFEFANMIGVKPKFWKSEPGPSYYIIK